MQTQKIKQNYLIFVLTSQPQHPTAFSKEMADMSRNILLERYRLLPFLYTLLYHAHKDSSTVVRPLLNE